jgi:hypothetical protein
MNDNTDHLLHVWLNARAESERGYDKPCVWCGTLLSEHDNPDGRYDKRMCPGSTSAYYTPPKFVEDADHPKIGTMYAFKSAMQLIPWAAVAIKKAREGALPTTHQQCSHSKPEPIKNNVMRCWLGKDVAQCPILADLQASVDTERVRTLPNGKPSYYAEVTQDEVYEMMASVCTWHLLMSHIASETKELPKPSYVDWNEGAFQDTSDRMFWDRVYQGCDLSEGE